MAPIRVAFTTLAPFISGAERSLQVTLTHLPAAGVQPLVLGPRSTGMQDWCSGAGVPYAPVALAPRDARHPLRWWRSVYALRRILRQSAIDVVHSNQLLSYPAVAAAAGSLRLPRVCHLRDETSPEALRWWCRDVPDTLIAISRHIAGQAGRAWPDGDGPEVLIMMNPVLLPAPHTPEGDARQRRDARAAWGLPPDALVFGFIGQIREVKGLLELMDAVARLPRDKEWRLLVAGHDPSPGAEHERLCRQRASRSDLAGRVVFTGFLDDAVGFYRAIDVAVVPSREEPLGRVPLEAAAHCRAAVVSAVGGLPEVVRHDETGWLVPAGDISALAGRLGTLTHAQGVEFGAAARRWVETIAEPGAYAARLAALYRRLLWG
jgi:glycosyltransferase involved in cell wall biosynthesis